MEVLKGAKEKYDGREQWGRKEMRPKGDQLSRGMEDRIDYNIDLIDYLL